jgi:short-subunit dehydrogenase
MLSAPIRVRALIAADNPCEHGCLNDSVTTRTNILITGASSGLGEGMARLFAERGRNLALTARRADRLETLAGELRAKHPDIAIVAKQLDVNDHDQIGEVFRDCDVALGGLERVIVNAGLGKGAPIGSGRFDVNRDTVATNFIGALAQCEAAMELFYAAGAGHLVVMSSIQAVRGMPRGMAAYAASKAGVAALAEGIRADCLGTPINVTTLMPGYIESEMTDRLKQKPRLMVDTATGCRALVAAIEREVDVAVLPAWPWKPIGFALRRLPLRAVRRLV